MNFLRNCNFIKGVGIGLIALTSSGCLIKGLKSNVDTTTSPAAKVDRPPQYVMMAFDGSYDQIMWDNVLKHSRELTADKKPVHWTIFLSCVYYLWRNGTEHGSGTSGMYHCPHIKNGIKEENCPYDDTNPDANAATRGRACLGNADNQNDVLLRVEKTNQAKLEGHEIGSHSCSHCGGDVYSQDQWESEFSQFDRFVFGAIRENGITESMIGKEKVSLVTAADVLGFRAPFLKFKKENLWPVLKKHGFIYDTSSPDGGSPGTWPKKVDGIWEYPLALLKIAGTNDHTMSMDYNFYYYDQSKNIGPAQAEEQMYKSYMNYFMQSYYSNGNGNGTQGNRAPIHIGHHYSGWNGAAYWKALKRFSTQVCGMPEVKCVTYKELTDFMNATPPETLKAYQEGKFEKLLAPQSQSLSLADSFELSDIDDAKIDPTRTFSVDEWNAMGVKTVVPPKRCGDGEEVPVPRD